VANDADAIEPERPCQLVDVDRHRLLVSCGRPVEFFNLILGTQLTSDEKRELVAFLRAL
jgi:hypothetical protein